MREDNLDDDGEGEEKSDDDAESLGGEETGGEYEGLDIESDAEEI
jgi:hypothetical protein